VGPCENAASSPGAYPEELVEVERAQTHELPAIKAAEHRPMWGHVITSACSPGPHPKELVKVKRADNLRDPSPKGSADCACPAMTNQRSAAGQQAVVRHRPLYQSCGHAQRTIFVQSSESIRQLLPAPCTDKGTSCFDNEQVLFEQTCPHEAKEPHA
jgi:hypothetical protein